MQPTDRDSSWHQRARISFETRALCARDANLYANTTTRVKIIMRKFTHKPKPPLGEITHPPGLASFGS